MWKIIKTNSTVIVSLILFAAYALFFIFDTGAPIKAIYLVQGDGQLSKEELKDFPEIYVTNSFNDFKLFGFRKVALWIDINAVGLVDRAWLDKWPQKYYPLFLIGTSNHLCAFRDMLGGFGIIEGPPADCTTPQEGFSIWMLRHESLNGASAFMHGYEQTPNVQDILVHTYFLLGQISLPTNPQKLINTPRPTNTPWPIATSTHTPSPIVLSGIGNSIVDIQKWPGPAIAHITYNGSGNFIVWNYGSNNEKINLLVNAIGNYEGKLPLDLIDGEETTRLEIYGKGEWKIIILPFKRIQYTSIPGVIEGGGDDVIMLKGTLRPDLLKIKGTQADSKLVIWGYGNSTKVLVYEASPYSETVMVPNILQTRSGSLLLIVEAEGNWSIEVTVK